MSHVLPELLADAEEGFADFSFRITGSARGSDGMISFVIQAISDGQTVGLTIVLGREWRPAKVGEKIPVFWGTVSYVSNGAESDRLLNAIAAAYGIAPGDTAMARRVRFSAVALRGNPMNCLAEPVEMKLFIDSGAPERYAEVYTNVDPHNQRVAIREKDGAYRAPLVAALAPVSEQ